MAQSNDAGQAGGNQVGADEALASRKVTTLESGGESDGAAIDMAQSNDTGKARLTSTSGDQALASRR